MGQVGVENSCVDCGQVSTSAVRQVSVSRRRLNGGCVKWAADSIWPIVPSQHHHRKQPPAGKRRLAGSRAGFRSQSAQRSPGHHRPRCPSTAPSTRAWSDPVGVERPSGSSCACRSMSPSSSASSAYRRPKDPGLRPPPSARRSSRTDGSRHAVSRAGGSERGSLPTSRRPSRSRRLQPCASARSVRTAQAAAFSAARPWRVKAPGFHASRRAPAG